MVGTTDIQTFAVTSDSRHSLARQNGRRPRHARHHIDGTATAFELSGERFGNIHTLRAIEQDESGIDALTDEIVPRGTTVALGFEERGRVARSGVVTQCESGQAGYRLTIALSESGHLPAD